MPFRKAFEKRVNDEMQSTTEAGPSHQPHPPSPLPSPSTFAGTDIKTPSKCPPSPSKASSIYEQDLDLSRKPDKSLPPRFSTLFDNSAPAPTPRVVECCHRSEKSRRGVFLSMPVFVLLVVVLLFESTLLFAYTVIGLYQNLPPGFARVMGVDVAAPGPADGCHGGEEGRGVVNIAPKFVFGSEGASMMSGFDGAATMIEATTAAEAAGTIANPTTTTAATSSKTSTTPTSIDSTAAAAASQLLDILSDATKDPPTASVAIVTSTPGVVQSTILVTSSVGEEGETGSEVRPTVTSVKVVNGPETTIQATDAAVTGGGGDLGA